MSRERILKEWTALRPGWVVSLILAALPMWIWPEADNTPIWLLGAYLGWTLLAMGCFCPEFSHRTFQLLLSQPQERLVIWSEKLRALRWALGSGLLLLLVCAHSLFVVSDQAFSYALFLGMLVGGLACAVGGGLYFSLLFRHPAAAFAFTIFLPFGLFLAIVLVLDWAGVQVADSGEWLLTIPLWVSGFLLLRLARRRFLNAEDVEPWAAEVIVFGGRRQKSGVTLAAPRLSSPTFSLIGKELRLQQITYVFAGLLVLLGLLIVVADRFRPAESSFSNYLESARTMWLLLWGLIPLFVGSVSISEERRLGLFEWQRTMPVSGRRQWLLKVLTAYALAFVAGVALPQGLNLLLFGWLGDSAPRFSSLGRDMRLYFPLVSWLIGTTLGLLASSLARQLIHALSIAVGVGFAVGAWLWLVHLLTQHLIPMVWPLLTVVSTTVLFPLLLALSCHNYLRSELRPALWRKNILCLAGGLLTLAFATVAIYCRSWEALLPEPAPVGVVSNTHIPPRILPNPRGVAVLAPDGGLWDWDLDKAGSDVLAGGRGGIPLERVGLEGKGAWRGVARLGSRLIALNADGSVWQSGGPMMANVPGRGLVQVPGAQLGRWDAGPWRQIAVAGSRFAGIKSDGSLWTAGVFPGGPENRSATVALQDPRQLGTETNWTLIHAGGASFVAAKSDGSLWGWGYGRSLGLAARDFGTPALLPGSVPGARDAWTLGPPTRNPWTFLEMSFEGGLGVRADGSLWAWGDLSSRLTEDAGGGAIVRVGEESDWQVVTAGYGQCFALKKDGSLWRWGASGYEAVDDNDRMYWSEKRLHWLLGIGKWIGLSVPTGEPQLKPHRIGRRYDWVDVTSFYGSSFAMTADGVLWTWGRPIDETLLLFEQRAGHRPLTMPWTAYTQRPRRLMNLITGDVY